ncbi:hypothetical protein F4808DRAFT_459344 [Astrocystis sublimbata]|nr:hypothetical protein F4808DRAFT_459344 [Astrocystis sublimbata]
MEDELKKAAAAALPTPVGTPYRTPSRKSRKPRRSITPTGIPSSSPPDSPAEKTENRNKRISRELAAEENLSILDPRRFTPTLHANLVSEILALRRDQDDKLKIIEDLETSLHGVQEEKEVLQSNISETAKESRSLKRQLAVLEGGTSSALGDITQERDEAIETSADTKRRLEAAQKKIRAQEEDSQRVHNLWAKERDDWEEERRKFERRVHVAETRLKAVLEEVESLQLAQANVAQPGLESDAEDNDNDSASARTHSLTSSVRFSAINGAGLGKLNGISLADELNFDEDEDSETDPDGRQSVLSNPGHNRNLSRESVISRKHQRNFSIESQIRSRSRSGSLARGRRLTNPTVLATVQDDIKEDEEIQFSKQTAEYTDAAVQYSPPPSPELAPSKPSSRESVARAEDLLEEIERSQRGDSEIEANQRRKRVHVNRSNGSDDAKPTMRTTVSSGSQTTEPLSAPGMPPFSTRMSASETTMKAAETRSAATQTDKAPDRKHVAPLTIPSISVVPPTSLPPTPREHRLPQHSKDIGCQVSIIQQPVVMSQSVAVQTEEIRVDKRLDRLPRHLHPSAISSRPSSPKANPEIEAHAFTPVPGKLPARNPRRLAKKQSFESSHQAKRWYASEAHDNYPGNNDNGPLSGDRGFLQRPPRISSLFAGFDVGSSDDGDEFEDGDFSDVEYRTALSAPNPNPGTNRHGKESTPSMGSMSPDSVVGPSARDSQSIAKQAGQSEIYSSFTLANARNARNAPVRKQSSRPPSVGTNASSRGSGMRKAAMVQNGISTHHGRSGSPSLPDIKEPPFPIPTRASSRQPAFTASAPSDGPHSPSRYGGGWQRRRKGSIYSNNSLRKVRSVAALPRGGRYRRQGSRSPPLLSGSEDAPESPQLPPLPDNDITAPRNGYHTHRHQLSNNTANTELTNAFSVASSQQAPGVVEAIAQTMVGEWMFKYVRRRKSFGVADGSREENSNDRHKRWVWLSPYERAILWSSKQPVSGNALMGKPGRKLTIQSVLDVKDDNPIPKGETHIFNRSILILTPQRALKFTAISAERHYLWLMSLSFLAHSQQEVPDITPSLAPPKAAPPPDRDISKAKIKRGGIRDSIRLTKGRNPTFTRRHGPDIQSSLPEEPEPLPSFPVDMDADGLGPIATHQRDLSNDSAAPPRIQRFNGRGQGRVHECASQVALHGRKRSNTGGHVPPPVSFRGFSPAPSSMHDSANSAAGASFDTAGFSDIKSQVSSNMTRANSAAGSQRTSDALSRPNGNFFEAIGTVRMEAFISPLANVPSTPNRTEETRHRARRQSKERRRRHSRSRHRDIYGSRGGSRGTNSYYAGSRAGDEESHYGEDPFRGF